MKKVFSFLIAALAVSTTQAQDINDAYRYSSEQLGGTARYRALSGAFGALGGDLSAMSANPAGSAVFSTGEVGATFGNSSIRNNSLYFGTLATDSKSKFDLSQSGGVLVFNNQSKEANWRKIAVGFNVENSNSFNNNVFVAGFNPNNSIDKYFLSYANGVTLDDIEVYDGENVTEVYRWLGENRGYGAQQAFLAYQAYLINPISNDPENTQYVSNASYGTVDQEYFMATTGYNYKITFNFATQYKDKLYLGANLNAHAIDFSKYTYLSEIGFASNSTIQEIGFENDLKTYGSGFSFQLGAIAKLSDELRIGATYQSPTWYNINDELIQSLFTVSEVDNGDGTFTEFTDVVEPNVINIYETYKLMTPSKITGSLAYVFGKYGLISFDYSRKNYANAEFRPTSDSYFRDQNSIISNQLKDASSYRIGGELRVDNVSLRAGYRLEESPYKNERTVGELNGYSLGIGYNFGAVSLDIAYDHAKQDSYRSLYNVGLTDAATTSSKFNNVMMSIGIKL